MRDRVKIKIRSGNGGDGGRNLRDGKPYGGDGGKGGDVIIIGNRNLYDLNKYANMQRFEAENGQMGSQHRKNGKAGEDLILKVPLTTTIYDSEGKIITKISKHDQQYKILEGGKPGFGNYFFRGGKYQTATERYAGFPGEEMEITLELNLSADIIFIGFPNAGKSSLLNALTNANVKVAPYPFTTLSPNLAVAQGMLLMDLPGLIEGTAEGKGLGSGFTKHTQTARLIVHFISLENEDLLERYQTMRKELEDIKLDHLPEVILFTKSDLYNDEEIASKIAPVVKANPKHMIVSSFDYSQMEEITKFLRKELK